MSSTTDVGRGRRAAAMVVAALMVAAMAAGCTGGDETGGGSAQETPSPTPTGWGPPLTPEQAYEQIPRDGTTEAPLRWDVPEVAGAEAEVLAAAERYVAMSYYEWSLREPDEVAHLYQYVVSQRLLDTLFPDGPATRDGSDPWAGPVWVAVLDVEHLSDTRARVHLCRDHGWWEQVSRADQLPRVNRAVTGWLELTRERVNDGDPRWLVDDDVASPYTPRYGTECEAWADHTP